MKALCMTKRGCHIGDIAPSHHLNELADAFLLIESLSFSSGYGAYQDKIMRDSGLINETVETIGELKFVMSKFRESKQNSK